MNFLLNLVVSSLKRKTENFSFFHFIGKTLLRTAKSKIINSLPFPNEITNLLMLLKKKNKKLKDATLIILGDLANELGLTAVPQVWQKIIQEKDKPNTIFKNFSDDLERIARIDKVKNFYQTLDKIYKGILGKNREATIKEVATVLKNFNNQQKKQDINKWVNENTNIIDKNNIYDSNYENKIAIQVNKNIFDDFYGKNVIPTVKANTNKVEDENKMADQLFQGQNSEFVKLNSSWLLNGYYSLVDTKGYFGNMTVHIRQNKKGAKLYGPYTYPMVPLSTWLEMKNSSDHAGTIFWKLYLHQWISSSLRQFVKNKLADLNIKVMNKLTKDIYSEQLLKVDRYIKQWSTINFYRTKSYREANKTKWEFGIKKWRLQQIKTTKKYLKVNKIRNPYKFTNRYMKGVK